MELDEVLNEPEAPEPEPPAEPPKPDLGARKAFQEKEQAAQEEGRQVEETARGADGKFVAKEPEPKDPEPKPVSQELTDKERAFLARANDETRKRQALEQELAQLRAKATPAEPPKPFFDDPDGSLKAHQERISQEVAQQVQQMRQELIQQRLQNSEAIARSKYEDFGEMVPVFGELLQSTPGLYQQWMQSPDPAVFAYQAAKNMQQVRQAGSMDEIRKQAEKEARIKIEAEYKSKEAALLRKKEAIPESLSGVRSASQPKVTWGGPPSLDDILK